MPYLFLLTTSLAQTQQVNPSFSIIRAILTMDPIPLINRLEENRLKERVNQSQGNRPLYDWTIFMKMMSPLAA